MIVLMLVLNGLFAAYEMALASISRSRLAVLAGQKKKGARAALAMKDRMEASLAVVQVGITLAGAIASAVGGVGVEETLSPWFERVLGMSPHWAEVVAVAAFVIPLSAVTIVFSELVPKMFAIQNSEQVCLKMAPVMRVLATVLYPVVALFEGIVKAIMSGSRKLVNEDLSPERTRSLHELQAAAALARTAKLIGAREEKIVLAAAQLPSRPIGSIVVPVEMISSIPASSSLAEAVLIVHLDLHTRFPVCADSGDPQSIVGYVTFKDLVVALKMEAQTARVKSIMRPIARFRHSDSIAQALEHMIRDKIHIALVETDEKRILGMVTLEDIMEELVGEIEDEFDRLPSYMHQTESGWIVGGGTRLETVAATIGACAAPGPGAGAGTTLADWCVQVLGRPVEKGETIVHDGLVLNVRKLRRQKVAECFVSQAKGSGAA